MNLARFITGSLLIAALAVSAPLARAQQKDQRTQPAAPAAAANQNGDTVVMRINGYNVTVNELRLASEDLSVQLPNVPPEMRYPLIAQYLLERHLLAQKAIKDGMTNSDEYKRRVRFYQYKALRDAYFVKKIKPQVTDAVLRKIYDEEAKKFKPVERVRARHILVSSREEAEKVLKELKAGAKFEELAKKYSKDGSKEFGGDLGYFTADEMVPAFSKAVFALKKGEVTQEPVKTDYGWHIIRLEDRKKVGMQPFEAVKKVLRATLLRRKVEEAVFKLRQQARVEFLDPDLKKLYDAARKRAEQLRKKQQAGQGKAPQNGPKK
ncbi:MAG TPA: peptidylprolyl isomerase [Thermopetrobacter sp.]|nr:peptidylprolyl isomerase [Thermopetrobacter sp.]